MMEVGKIEEQLCQIKVLTSGEFKADFIPWSVGDRGQQSYIKLKRNDETAYLYSGVGTVLKAEIQKALMRLVNEGWFTQGEVHISFEGSTDPDIDMLLERDNLALELGAALLPLVDPYQGSPLLERLTVLREEIAREVGFVVPSVKVRDNMKIQPNQYVIKLRESQAAAGELYLNRLLAIGSLEQLGGFPGWSTIEPAYRMNAKWIEPGDRDAAEKAGCMVQGGLNVLLTHLKETVKANARSVLGLQETSHLLERLSNSHPVVVEEFLGDVKKLRNVRKILQNLLAEKVPVNDLVTIMEIIGDNMEDIRNTALMTEYVRRGLSRQICWSLVGDDGFLRIMTLSSKLEDELQSCLRDTVDGAYLYLTAGQQEKLLKAIKKSIDDQGMPLTIVTRPSLRIYLWNLLGDQISSLTLLSTAEVSSDIRISALGEIKESLGTGSEAEKKDTREEKSEEHRGTKKKKAGKFWTKE